MLSSETETTQGFEASTSPGQTTSNEPSTTTTTTTIKSSTLQHKLIRQDDEVTVRSSLTPQQPMTNKRPPPFESSNETGVQGKRYLCKFCQFYRQKTLIHFNSYILCCL